MSEFVNFNTGAKLPDSVDENGLYFIETPDGINRIYKGKTQFSEYPYTSAGEHYTIHFNGKESDPASIITYLGNTQLMTPAKMDLSTGIFNWGTWKNAFFIPRPCVLQQDGTVSDYLQENDYTKTESGAAAPTLETDGNCMMEWPQIWLKITPDESDPLSATIDIASSRIDSGYHCYNCYDINNELHDHFYTPIYQGSLDSSGRLRSVSGASHMRSKTAEQERAAARLNGNTRYDIESFGDRQLITFLLWLIGRSTATQEIFGLGHSTDSWTESHMFLSGTMDKKGMFFGNSNSGDSSKSSETSGNGDGVKVFGMENWWGDQWRRVVGYFNDKGAQKYKFTPGTADGSTATDYNITAEGYINSGVTHPTIGGSAASNAYIKNIQWTKYGYLIQSLGGSESTYITDYNWYNNNQLNMARFGGALDAGRKCGASSVALSDSPALAWWGAGVGLSYR